jgi:hypothetical protein
MGKSSSAYHSPSAREIRVLYITYVRAWAGLPRRHADCTWSSLSERRASAVGMSDGSQNSRSFAMSASACSRSIQRAAASPASRARVSMGDASSSNSHFVL